MIIVIYSVTTTPKRQKMVKFLNSLNKDKGKIATHIINIGQKLYPASVNIGGNESPNVYERKFEISLFC